MPGLSIREVLDIKSRTGYGAIAVFIETGTLKAETAVKMCAVFDICHTIEGSKELYDEAQKNYGGSRIHFHYGSSPEKLKVVIQDLDEPAVFFLDAHAYKSNLNIYTQDPAPLLRELEVLKDRKDYMDIIIIDDYRCFGVKNNSIDWSSITLEKVIETLGKDTIRELRRENDKVIIFRGEPDKNVKRKFTVNLVYDLTQYRLCLDPIRDECVKRGHGVQGSKSGPSKQKVDCSIMIQAPGPVQGTQRPRVFIQHGLSCLKGWDNNQPVDYMITPAPYWTEELSRRQKADARRKPYKIIGDLGWPRMDVWYKYLQKRELCVKRVRERHQLDTRPIVVYFPTYAGGGHSTRPVRVDDVFHLLSSHYNVFVGPHQMEGGTRQEEYMKGLSLAVRSPGPDCRLLLYRDLQADAKYYLEDLPRSVNPDKWEASVHQRIEYMVAADALVGDISGTVFEYLSTGKPLILIDKPEDPAYFHLNHKESNQVFDAPHKATMQNLVMTIDKALANPEDLADRRAYWKEFVVGPVDGQCSKRIVDFLETLF